MILQGLAARGKVPWCEGKSVAGSCGGSARREEDGDPGDLLLAKEKRKTKPTAVGGRCEEKAWSRKAASSELPVEQKKVRRPKGYAPLAAYEGKNVLRERRCVAGALTRYAIGPGARNAACVTFDTGC